MPRRPAPGQLHAANSLSLPSCTKMWLQFTPNDLISNKDLQNREVVIFESRTEELQSSLENHTPRGSFCLVHTMEYSLYAWLTLVNPVKHFGIAKTLQLLFGTTTTTNYYCTMATRTGQKNQNQWMEDEVEDLKVLMA